jgi:hypothetical protein
LGSWEERVLFTEVGFTEKQNGFNSLLVHGSQNTQEIFRLPILGKGFFWGELRVTGAVGRVSDQERQC